MKKKKRFTIKRRKHIKIIKNKITKNKFTKLMNYPAQWMIWNLYPTELFKLQLEEYEIGHENSSEHYRYGAFQWWISKKPSEEIKIKLFELSQFDSDPFMAYTVGEDIFNS